MPWIPDVNPDELIESAWGNTIRDHVVHVFASEAERAAAIPAPDEGMVAYLTGSKVADVYSGTAWIPFSLGATAAAGNSVPVRLRSETVVATTDGSGNVATTLAPPLGLVIAIIAVPSDIQLPFHVQPYRSQFSPGATTVTWNFKTPANTAFASSAVRFDYVILDRP
jgi:hypothetical protein